MEIKNICICGGGGQCHALAPWFSLKGFNVTVLTRRPQKWEHDISLYYLNEAPKKAHIMAITDSPKEAVSDADLVLVTVPGYLNREELLKIKPYLKKDVYVGGVFSSNGFFFDALELLDDTTPIWGFQRVPYIGKVWEYGHSANITGIKTCHHIAMEHASEEQKNTLQKCLEHTLGQPVIMHQNYLEVALSNSNPLLHPARLYSLLGKWDFKSPIKNNPLFYEEWTDDASEYLIELDNELHNLIQRLPIAKDCLPSILKYYECSNPSALTRKLSSIEAFKGIRSPYIKTEEGWIPDKDSRYFSEDFNYGLNKYRELAHKNGVEVPLMDEIYHWEQELMKALSSNDQ